MVLEPVRVMFDVVATVVLAYLVFYLANDVVAVAVQKRPLIWGPTGRPLHPAVRLAVIAFEATGIVGFSWLTLSAALTPQTSTSLLNTVIYWLASLVELVVIARAAMRAYRIATH